MEGVLNAFGRFVKNKRLKNRLGNRVHDHNADGDFKVFTHTPFTEFILAKAVFLRKTKSIHSLNSLNHLP